MSQNTSDVFSQKLEEAAAAREAEAIAMEFEGFPCRVLPLPRMFFISAGRMPEYLTQRVIALVDRLPNADDDEQRSATHLVEIESFRREAVCSVLVEPRVVVSGDVPPGGYLYADLVRIAPAFIAAVYTWIMHDCPMPAGEKGEGVLGVEDLANFSGGGGRVKRSGARSGGKGKRAKAVGASAAD